MCIFVTNKMKYLFVTWTHCRKNRIQPITWVVWHMHDMSCKKFVQFILLSLLMYYIYPQMCIELLMTATPQNKWIWVKNENTERYVRKIFFKIHLNLLGVSLSLRMCSFSNIILRIPFLHFQNQHLFPPDYIFKCECTINN